MLLHISHKIRSGNRRKIPVLIILKAYNKMTYFLLFRLMKEFIIKKRRTYPNGRWKSICVFMTLHRDPHAELPGVSIRS